jgi:hypothetical protein
LKAGYEKGLNKVSLHIDLPYLYEEDYQMFMLRENNVSGLLDISGCGMNGKSRYSFVVTGTVSMKTMFENSPIQKEVMETFVHYLMEAVKELKRFMLNPDSLLLYPEFVFFGNDRWSFCYLPGRKKPLSEGFHIITEYFVKRLDYKETEAIMLAYELHKATLQENYDLEKIMREYKLHEQDRYQGEAAKINEGQGSLPQEHINTFDEEDDEATAASEVLCEDGGWSSPWKKAANRFKKGKWGRWNDLILETDGHEREEPL